MFLKLMKILKIGNKKNKASQGPAGEPMKNGIRKFESDDEMLEAFGVNAPDEKPPEAFKKKPLYNKKDVRKKKGVDKREKLPVDKNGFPVLDHVEDYSSLMTEVCESDINSPAPVKEAIKETRAQKKILKTRHGIPILSNDDDYASLFSDSPSDVGFNEILAESLGGKSAEVLLREKRDSVNSVKKMSVKQRLKRYPLPQGQLDLHGYTSVKADLKAESYLKNAFYNGTYTVSIIVGKGLHSEDGPVLPDIIEKRIIRMKNEKIILAYEWDKKKKSKSGAVTVFLNNYRI